MRALHDISAKEAGHCVRAELALWQRLGGDQPRIRACIHHRALQEGCRDALISLRALPHRRVQLCMTASWCHACCMLRTMRQGKRAGRTSFRLAVETQLGL